MEKLKPCPFCGKDVAEFAMVCTLEECANFEEEDCPECYDPAGSDGCMHLVICSINKGGCGSSTGRYVNKERAAEAWNRRVI